MTIYQLIKEWRIKHGRDVLFKATRIDTGMRARYKAVEHLNVGEVYLLVDAANPIGRCVPDIKLKDLVVIEPQA